MIYCLRCKKHTDTKGVTLITLGNGKVAETGECVVCGSKKFRLTSSRGKKVAGGDILTTLTPFVKGITFPGQKYPGEMHYPGASFMGPFTRLDLRLNPDGTPLPGSSVGEIFICLKPYNDISGFCWVIFDSKIKSFHM